MHTAVSPRVRVCPPGLVSSQDGWLTLSQHASAAFGDGHHPTTRLCAGAVDLLCRQTAGLRVLDVGTGTGLLARIARARGCSFAAGTDIDPVALVAARDNLLLDDHPLEVPVLAVAPSHWGATFDLVVANILEGPLRELAPELQAALAPRGSLLLSGFTPLQSPMIQAHYAQHGLACLQEARLEGWSMLMLRLA